MQDDHGVLQQPPFQWLEAPWHRLTASANDGRLSHAILITGPGGIGEEHLAVAMGHYLLCAGPAGQRSCGRCKSCSLLKAGSHPDFHQVQPEDSGKAIKIDQIRKITQVAGTTPQQGGRMIVVINPAEQMNRNAANALLKLLEEPGPNCHFLLVSSQPARILATIKSRCLQLPLGLPDRLEAAAWLAQQGVESHRQYLELSGGRPLRVLSWLENGLFEKKETVIAAVERLVSGEISEIECARQWAGLEAGWLLDELLSVLMAAIKWRAVGTVANEAHPNHTVFSSSADSALHHLYQALLNRKRSVQKGTNLNADIFLAELAVEITEAIQLPTEPRPAFGGRVQL